MSSSNARNVNAYYTDVRNAGPLDISTNVNADLKDLKFKYGFKGHN